MRHIAHAMFGIFAFLGLAVFVYVPMIHGIDALSSSQVATVTSAGASVAPNPINTLAEQMNDRAAKLDARANDLNARAEALNAEQEAVNAHDRTLLLYMLGIASLSFLVLQRYVRYREHKFIRALLARGTPAPKALMLPHTPYTTDLHEIAGHRA